MRASGLLYGMFVVLLAFSSSACSTSENKTNDDVVLEEGAGSDFKASVSGAIADTLTGSGSYGNVMDPATGKQRWVVKLTTSADLTGGVLISRAQPEPPLRGRHNIGNAVEENVSVPDSQFVIFYRSGLEHYLKSTDGWLDLKTVSDTLVEGSFNANLKGWATVDGQIVHDREARIRGSFRAEGRPVGYIIGL